MQYRCVLFLHWHLFFPRPKAKATFEVGPAIAVAKATTAFCGVTTDAHQWLVNITLVEE